MSFFDKLLPKVDIFSMLNMAGIDLGEYAVKAKSGITDLLRQQEAEQGTNVLAVCNLNEDKTDFILSLYRQTENGLEFYKEIDLSDPKKLIDILKNSKEDAQPQHTAIANQPIQQPAASEQPTATASDTDTDTDAASNG